MKAAEIKKIAEGSVDEEEFKERLAKVERYIENRAKHGNTETTYSYRSMGSQAMAERIISELRKNGFTVSDFVQYDNRGRGWKSIRIAW